MAIVILLAMIGTGWAGQPVPGTLSLYRGIEKTTITEGLPPTVSVLEEYLAHAVKESPALQAAFHDWQAVIARSGYTGALPNPIVSYSYFGAPVETRVGPQEQRFSVRQAVPWPGTLGARKEITSRAADAAYQKYQSKKLQLLYEVKAAYYEYYYLGRELAVTRDNLELLKFWESIVRARYRLALTQHPDLIKVQVELGKLENRLQTIEDMVAPAVARLRAVTNLPDSVSVTIPKAISINELILDHDDIVRAALENNPGLKSLIHTIQKEEAGVRLAGKSTRPSFIMGFDYIQTGDALNPDLLDSGKDPWMVSVGITLPVWFGANSARKREAEASRRSAEYAYSDAQNRLRAFTEKILFEYADALRQIRLYRDGLVPKAEQSLNASYAAYQAGEADLLNLLDTQRQLLDFQLQYERSKSSLAIRQAEIEMLTGKEL